MGEAGEYQMPPPESAGKQESLNQNDLLLPPGKKASWLRAGFLPDKDGNWPLGLTIESRMSRPGGVNAYVASKAETFMGIHVPDEIEVEADKIEREEAGSLTARNYLDVVAEKLGWLENEIGYIIPADQIERLTPEQYQKLLKGNREEEVWSWTESSSQITTE